MFNLYDQGQSDLYLIHKKDTIMYLIFVLKNIGKFNYGLNSSFPSFNFISGVFANSD